MTKLTVTQAVEAIRNETTVEGITTVLMDCTKAVMAEAYAELTGEKYCGSLNSRRKTELAAEITQSILIAREKEAFKALTVKEKLEELRDAPYSAKLLLCSLEELKEMARMLGVYDSDYADEDEEYWLGTVSNELRVRMLVKECRKTASEGDTKYGTAKERILFRMMHMPYAVRIRMEEITGVESASLEDAKEQIAEYFLKESVAEDKEESTMTETCESAPVSQPASEATGVEYEPLTHSQIVFGKSESTLVDVCAGVENYESGKLTEEELSEILESATAETLREYIMEVISQKKPQAEIETENTLEDIYAGVDSFLRCEITPDELSETVEYASLSALKEYVRREGILLNPDRGIVSSICDDAWMKFEEQNMKGKIPA